MRRRHSSPMETIAANFSEVSTRRSLGGSRWVRFIFSLSCILTKELPFLAPQPAPERPRLLILAPDVDADPSWRRHGEPLSPDASAAASPAPPSSSHPRPVGGGPDASPPPLLNRAAAQKYAGVADSPHDARFAEASNRRHRPAHLSDAGSSGGGAKTAVARALPLDNCISLPLLSDPLACGICLASTRRSSMASRLISEEGDAASACSAVLPCGHIFHTVCKCGRGRAGERVCA